MLSPASPDFPSTRWTLIRKVQTGSEKESALALEQLCRSYWYPIYAYARRYGFGTEDAEDITQVFFQNLVSNESLQAVTEEKGKLRSFMLAMLKRIVSKHLRHDAAKKRGGSRAATLSFEELDAEARYASEPADTHDPDNLFDRVWARDVLAKAEAQLRADYAKADNTQTFEQLREFLPLGDNATPYAEAAKNLGINEATLRLQIHRMRKRYAKLIEGVIAETVNDAAEQKAELEHLMQVIGG
ncbi:MAG: sigma-70 family RNA polymerase sigma factor [Verrucomicrobiaceae bacterium]|nr:sigma-70 family RNA polymerase sigma factor [Verrucomicrobiaceae bacterium]